MGVNERKEHKPMKIGFLDSGIGGLSVLHNMRLRMPMGDYIYYADSDNAPYGEKSESRVRELVSVGVEHLISQGAEAVVLACNTATSVAASYLRSIHSIPIVGMEPAVKPAVRFHSSGRVLVTGTPVTIRGDKLTDLIGTVDSEGLTDRLALPALVRMAEERRFDATAAADYIKCEMRDAEPEKYSAVVLGCTHFNYFKDAFRRVFPSATAIIDGNDGTVSQLIRRVGAENLSGGGSVDYYISGKRVASGDPTLGYYAALLSRLDEMYRIK